MAYKPGPAPTDPKALPGYVRAELERVGQEFQPGFLQLKELHVAPERPRDGMICFFDGTDVNPDASGNPGFYGYHTGVWNRLG